MLSRVNLPALYAALDAARSARGLTWRDVADQAGLSPSTLSRLGKGKSPDANGFVSLVHWLGVPAGKFTVQPQNMQVPELEVQIALVLSAQPNLLPEDRQFLHEVLAASIKRIRQESRYE